MLSLPPGPKQSSWMQIIRLAYRPIEFLEGCRREFGDTFTIRLPGYPPWVVLSDPDDIKAVFTGRIEDLWAGPANAVLKPVLRENSLLLIDGDRHVAERKLMSPALHGEQMLATGATMAQTADDALATWPRGKAFGLHPHLQELTLDIILKTVFGIEDAGRFRDLRAKIVEFLELGSNPLALLLMRPDGEIPFFSTLRKLRFTPVGRAFGVLDEIDVLLHTEFARRRAEGVSERNDILSQFMALQDDAGKSLSDEWLRDEMMTLLLAGHETTATGLAWLLYQIASHPEVEKRLREEITHAGGAKASLHDLSRLPYFDAVIKESMRLTPVLSWVGRRLEKPMQVGKLNLPKGVLVFPSIYLTHRNPLLWPDPERFDPERFLNKPAAPNAFFPFGGGARRCIGMAFATYEMKIVTARLLMGAKIRLVDGYKAHVVRRGITYTPSEGLPVVIG